MADDCLFCRIARGEIPATIVARREGYLAFRDINPQAPVHVLVIPVQHVDSLNDVTDAALLGGLGLFAAEVAKAEGLGERGYRLIINTLGDGGQSVPHLHAHVVGGRRMTWPAG